MSVNLATVAIDASNLIPEIQALVDEMLEICAKGVEAAEVPIEGDGDYRLGFQNGYRNAKEDIISLLRGKKWNAE